MNGRTAPPGGEPPEPRLTPEQSKLVSQLRYLVYECHQELHVSSHGQ